MVEKINYPAELPIVAHKDQIVRAIIENPVVIVAGDTGSGKTTQLPKMCLEAGRGRKRRIGCTQPRRIAAISVADRVAEELGADGRRLVGYKIRFKDQTSRATRIKFMTDGMLLAETQQDRKLLAYDTIIIDEAHERSLNIDFLLGMVKRLLATRKDLRVIITSATIDTEKFAAKFDGAPVIEVSGRTYPVDVRYRPLDPEKEEEGEQTYIDRAVEAVAELRREDTAGDILVFMPTERDIRETVDALAEEFKRQKGGGRPAVVLPLFGRLSPADQSRIFKPARGQKIVVATNVAETSITVPGIRYVVDTGLARISLYNVRARTQKLPILPVSRASCDQRKGRCGRVGPGVCIRLYSEEDYLNRSEYTPPEILRANLAEVILRMISLRLGDPFEFPFVDPPAPRAVKDGYALLTELGAIDQRNHLTGKGRLMARLPLEPRISRMIIEARDNNALREVAVIAAALSIQDPRVRPAEKEAEADQAHARFVEPSSDFLFFLKLWDTYHNTFDKIKSQSRMRKFCKSHYLSYQRIREWQDIHEQISAILDEEQGFVKNKVPAAKDAVHRAVLSGNLRNIAMKKTGNIYQGAGGREVMIFPGSALFGKAGAWIMAAELVETTKLYARTVATIKPEWIEPLAGGQCRSSYSDPHWEKKRGQVVAIEKVTLFGLVIVAGRKVNFGRVKPDEARDIFIQSALVDGELRGSYAFLEHNRRLIADLRGMEDRVRRRDILVDDYALHQFYEKRLDSSVHDQAGLNRLLKKQRTDDFLRMAKEDILQQAPAGKQLEQFPKSLDFGDFSLQFTYKFDPSAEDDGVSVHIPVDLVTHCPSDRFEWLVPGLLLEKITFLLKGLPKSIRKQLIPIPATAEALMEDLEPYRGSLYGALEQAIYDGYRVRVDRRHWPVDSLPDHLKMRFCLTDGKGRIIKTSRRFSEVAEAPSLEAGTDAMLANLRRKWEQDEVASLAAIDVPGKIPITNRHGQLTGYAYPTLTADDKTGRISLRLYAERDKSRRLTRLALLALYRQQFQKQVKALKKDFSIPRAHWALYQGLATHEQINEDLLNFILEEVFHTREGGIQNGEEFEGRITEIKKQGLFPLGKPYMELVIEVLQERRAALDAINKFKQAPNSRDAQTASRFAEFHREVDRLVPSDFLEKSDSAHLADIIRYLKALRIRMERAHVSPQKDAAKVAQIAPHEKRLADLEKQDHHSPELLELVDEYRKMIEEFKISLFAQELKTAFPVSAKRLEQKWQELKRYS